MTAATIVRGGQDCGCRRCSRSWRDGAARAGSARPLMSGAEAALLGAAMPGGGGGGRGERPAAARSRLAQRRRADAVVPAARRHSRAPPRPYRGPRAAAIGGDTVEANLRSSRWPREDARARAARVSAPRAIDLAGQAGRGAGGRAADSRRTAALRRRPRGLSDALRRLSPARWPRPRTVAPPLVGSEFALGPAGNRGPHRAQRQGRTHRPDAAARLRARATTRSRPRSPTSAASGATPLAGRSGDRQGRPRTVDRRDPPMDGGRAGAAAPGAILMLNAEC